MLSHLKTWIKDMVRESVREEIEPVRQEFKSYMWKNVRTIVSNQIMLSGNSPGPRTIELPLGGQQGVMLHVTEEGRLCFMPPLENYNKKPIFITTLPKSGTYFLGAILKDLGFQDTEMHGGSSFHDYRHKSLEQSLYDYQSFEVCLPYSVQVYLTLPGQFLLGHVPPQDIRANHAKGTVLLALRDLRHVIVSSMRFNAKRARCSDREYMTPEVINQRICWLTELARGCVSLMDYTRLVRFEDLVSGDGGRLAEPVAAISAVTGCPEDRVRSAVDLAYNTPTMTYSGSRTRLDEYWTEDMEALFLREGGDVLNEQMGYSRAWNRA